MKCDSAKLGLILINQLPTGTPLLGCENRGVAVRDAFWSFWFVSVVSIVLLFVLLLEDS